MRSTRFKSSTILLLTLMAGLNACSRTPPMDAEAGSAESVSATLMPVVRPMKMELTVLLQGPVGSPAAQCVVAHVSSVLEGTATHLGRFHGVGETCILDIAPDANPPLVPPGPPPYLTAHFTNPLWVLTAANGEELWLQSGVAVAVLGLNPADGSTTSLRAAGTHYIIGGTGRFAGATGELQTTAVNEDGQGADEAVSIGWIRY